RLQSLTLEKKKVDRNVGLLSFVRELPRPRDDPSTACPQPASCPRCRQAAIPSWAGRFDGNKTSEIRVSPSLLLPASKGSRLAGCPSRGRTPRPVACSAGERPTREFGRVH